MDIEEPKCTGWQRLEVFGVPIDAVSWNQALSALLSWGRRRESRVVCICNAHSVITAKRDRSFRSVLEASDMATPDGAPVAWALRRQGCMGQQRVNGPDLMWRCCNAIAQTTISVFLYGGTPDALDKVCTNLQARWPTLRIAGRWSPPFRDLTRGEDEKIVQVINASGAGIVWVSLGCPKQERWMHAHKGRVNAVMVGVGAAFDYHARTLPRAPLWMQHHALEWLYRFAREPRRLYKRYAVTNTLFIYYAVYELLFGKRQ